jgi:ribosome biogenesis GTPase A
VSWPPHSIPSQEDELELLDSPGIIAAKQVEQDTALKLAVCNDIGQVCVCVLCLRVC